jgi:hypothetical protein
MGEVVGTKKVLSHFPRNSMATGHERNLLRIRTQTKEMAQNGS